jgi:hypothetical protein
MRSLAIPLLLIALASVSYAQVELISESYFPAALEFQELQTLTSETLIEDPAQIERLPNGTLFSALGCSKVARRTYQTVEGGTLSIEIVAAADSRAAFSLLTLASNSQTESGPPGDAFAATGDGIIFSQAGEWVRIQGAAIPAALVRRIADSISNRIGLDKGEAPSLISHLPEPGLNRASLRYYPGADAFKSLSESADKELLRFGSDMEIAQAQYALENQTGDLYLLDFPTPQVAEEFFAQWPNMKSEQNSRDLIYTKRVGPLVAILEGAFDPTTADRILDPLKYEYSIRWIYDIENQTRIIWGVPTQILGTVVKSLFFVALLCLLSVVAGAGFAFLRFGIRGRSLSGNSNEPDPDEIIRLRLR